MAPARAEPFQIALASLRDRLRAGAYPPGARVTAVDLADDLRLSTTPVREALSRLAGEGVIEDRRGQGYFVRALSATDVADLYRMSLAYLLIAQEPHRSRRATGALEIPAADVAPDPIRAVERLFVRWTADAGSRVLLDGLNGVQLQLSAIRRLEPLVLENLEAESVRLAALADPAPKSERLSALRQFHGRRIRVAEALAALLGRPSDAPGI